MRVNTGAAQRAATERDAYNGHVTTRADETREVKIITDNAPISLHMSAAEAASLAAALDSPAGSVVMLEVRSPVVATPKPVVEESAGEEGDEEAKAAKPVLAKAGGDARDERGRH